MKQVKRKTRVAKVRKRGLKATESSVRGSTENVSNATQVRTPSSISLDGFNSRRKASGGNAIYVPVVDANGSPLMPCHPARARELVRKNRAVRRFNKGLFYIKLRDRAGGSTQPITVGIDPGSKREGFSVKSESHTYLNLQAKAITWVEINMKLRRNIRRARRYHNTPYRKSRFNRSHNRFPASTKARWQLKLRIAKWLTSLYPISHFVVEDVKAPTLSKRGWDVMFSPLQYGKNWFYGELGKIATVSLVPGYDTAKLRALHGLKKSSSKLANKFEAHCVDSWVLANSYIGGHVIPDNTRIMILEPMKFMRRQLHKLQPSKGGVRCVAGGTRTMGLKRGSIVKHQKRGTVYLGGTSNGRVSLHDLKSGKRLCQNARITDVEFLAFGVWRTFFA